MEHQYTNEELVRMIQGGDQGQMWILWKQVEKLVSRMAKQYMINHILPGTVDFFDLYNSGYIALTDAVKTFSHDRGLFSTWFCIHLRNAFNYAAGITQKQQKDAMQHAVSLSSKIIDGEIMELGDTLPDPLAEGMLDNVEKDIFLEDLHSALDDALVILPKNESDVIQMYYFQGRSIQDIADYFQCAPSCISGRKHRALYKMGTQKPSRRLRSFLFFDYYGGSGLRAFQQSGMSIQERYVDFKEKHKSLPKREE